MPTHRVLIELTRKYTEPNRHYHNLTHIAWLLVAGRDLALSEEQILAIWFHDAVYDVRVDTNEEDSAKLAAELLGAEGYPASSIALVERIVLDTKPHVPSIEESKVVIDLDLGPLGLPWEEFDANSQLLQLETAPLGTDEISNRQRKFCHEFLGRERIYWTEWGAARESQARENIQRALQKLGG